MLIQKLIKHYTQYIVFYNSYTVGFLMHNDSMGPYFSARISQNHVGIATKWRLRVSFNFEEYKSIKWAHG